MRWRILRALMWKECLRHLANRGALVLILVLIVAAMLLSFFGTSENVGTGLLPSIQICYVDYVEESPLVSHLRQRIPAELADNLRFRPMHEVPTDSQGVLLYASNTASIQLRPPIEPGTSGTVWFWYPGDRSAISPYENWFWKETLRYVQSQRAEGEQEPPPTVMTAPLAEAGFSLISGLDTRSGLATSLVIFSVFFLCVYLLPSLTCEERERGVLLAQALSPASTWELLTARFIFYPTLAMILASLLAGLYDPRTLLRPFYWSSLFMTVVGFMGVGLVIATLARTQRSASMGAMCYLMAVSLVLIVCRQNQIPVLPWLALEYHCPRMIHAALSNSIQWYHWANLLGATILTITWVVVAGNLFRRYGWQ